MGERIPRTDEVTGSNPVCSIHILPKSNAVRKFMTTVSLLFPTSPAIAVKPSMVMGQTYSR